MLAAIEIKAITVTTQGIEIAGNRLGKLYQGGKPNYLKVGKVRIHLPNPTQGGGSNTELHKFLGKIFVEPGEDLRPFLPDY